MTVENSEAARTLSDALGVEQPFPWQVALLERFLRGDIPPALDIPTGLGKTATMAAWLVARVYGAALPRRLVYVVDRRAVVDQATTVAEGLRAWVAQHPEHATALGLEGRPLPISTLRGQHVDNRAWLEDPSAPAIIVGTVDMVGSRLLFSGYGVSSKMRPYHAGLLGADTLVVLDEAHLVPAFEDLLRQVENGADSFGPADPALGGLVPPFKLLSLSATGRQTTTGTAPLTLTQDDRQHEVVIKRLNARKALKIVELAAPSDAPSAEDSKESDDASETDDASKMDVASKKDKGPKLAAVLAREAWELTARGLEKCRCLVFCNERKVAQDVAAELNKLAKAATATIELLVGARRVLERTEVSAWLVEHGFVERKDGTRASAQRPTFLVATSAGEVGVDMDADHMVSDLVAWERMVQRLGRVNRRGDGDATVVVVVEGEPEPSDGTTKANEKRKASNEAKGQLDELRNKLSALQGEKAAVPKGQKKSADDKAAAEKRKHAEKALKSSISSCQKRIKAYKDSDAKIVERHDAEVARYRALRRLLAAVLADGGSLSPDALMALRARPDLADALRAATTVEPLRPELTRPLVDAWSMTSLEEHPGRPDVDPWLRGFRLSDPPQTTVVWRRHLPVRADEPFDAKAAKRFFEAAPIHTSEELETETHLVLAWLLQRAAAEAPKRTKEVASALHTRETNATLTDRTRAVLDEYERQSSLFERRPRSTAVVAVVLGPRGEIRDHRTLAQLQQLTGASAKKERPQLETLLKGATLVVDARLGGLRHGLLDQDAMETPNASDDATVAWLARPDRKDVPVTGFRIRTWGADDDAEPVGRAALETGWIRRHVFATKVVDGEPSAALIVEGWTRDAANEEERAAADRPQLLDEHQSWAADCANTIGRRLGIEQARVDLLVLAARLHDEGKRATRWQRAFKAPLDDRPYAKTKGPIDFDILDGYRHELGSLPYVEAHEDFKQLSSDGQDFVLHLIAAHHGFARPAIGTSGCDDAPPSIIEERARAVALRFSRLSRRWGPWGLAWWEALLRAADQTASRRNQQPAGAPKEQPR